jgi:hypothetical protein
VKLENAGLHLDLKENSNIIRWRRRWKKLIKLKMKMKEEMMMRKTTKIEVFSKLAKYFRKIHVITDEPYQTAMPTWHRRLHPYEQISYCSSN